MAKKKSDKVAVIDLVAKITVLITSIINLIMTLLRLGE